MSFSFRVCVPVFCVLVFIAGCSGSGADPYNGPGTVTPVDTTGVINTCPLAQENYTQPTIVDPQWTLVYGTNGYLYSAGGFNSSGMKTANFLTGATVLTLTTDGATGKYQFNQSLYTGKPSQYSFTDATGKVQNRAVTYDAAGNVAGLSLSDANSNPLASVTLSTGTGNITQYTYQELTGSNTLTQVYADTYDGHANPMRDMKGSAFLFYNWEYFSTPFNELGRLFQHLSTNNWTHYYCMQNGVKILEESISYQYNSKGYPTSGSLHILTYSSTGAPLSDETYAVTYTFPCQ